MECPFTEDELKSGKFAELEERAFQAAMESFNRKTTRIREQAWPTIKAVYEEQGHIYTRIVVPVTDGKFVYQLPCDLKEAYETECASIVKQFEKTTMLRIIDDAWKENLRQLDELKHSSQNASYEQKDPLLVFKLESVKLWDNMINDMNDRMASILMRGQLPEQNREEVREAAPEERQQRFQESKDDADNPGQNEMSETQQQMRQAVQQQQQVNHTPVVRDKMPRPNDLCPCGSGKKFKKCHGKGL